MFKITKELFEPVADGPADVILFDKLWPNGAEITIANFEKAVLKKEILESSKLIL